MRVDHPEYIKLSTDPQPSTLANFPAAFILGAMGGALGALYIFVNQKVNYIRKKMLKNSWLKIMECCLLTAITFSVFYFSPLLTSNDCYDLPSAASQYHNKDEYLK